MQKQKSTRCQTSDYLVFDTATALVCKLYRVSDDDHHRAGDEGQGHDDADGLVVPGDERAQESAAEKSDP